MLDQRIVPLSRQSQAQGRFGTEALHYGDQTTPYASRMEWLHDQDPFEERKETY